MAVVENLPLDLPLRSKTKHPLRHRFKEDHSIALVVGHVHQNVRTAHQIHDGRLPEPAVNFYLRMAGNRKTASIEVTDDGERCSSPHRFGKRGVCLESLREAVGLYLEEFPLTPAGAAFVTTISIAERA